MLTLEQIDENKQKYLTLLSHLNVDLTELWTYLEAVDFFHAPYSCYYKSYQGGLCEYSLQLLHELIKLADFYFQGSYKEEDFIKVALLGNIYRAELYEPYMKNVKDETGEWKQVLAYRYREKRATYGDIGFSSFMTARHFLDFTDEQVEAITQSNTKNDYSGDIYDIYRSYPLVVLIKMASLAVLSFQGDEK